MTINQLVVDENPLSGRALRFVLVDQLRERKTMTVAQMVLMLADQGYRLHGRPSKVISDALRWETARGRVVRVGRGVYRYGTAPRSTARRIRLFARSCREWLVAVKRGEEPAPTPPNTRTKPWWSVGDPEPGCPYRPPWQTLYWLWTI